MSINLSIIDQRLAGIQEQIKERALAELNIKDQGRLKSLSFCYLCVKTMLDLDMDECFECLTEGGGDFGIDAIHITEEMDGEFGVTLFQCKYKTKLEGTSNFDLKGINALINAIGCLFDPAVELGDVNDRLTPKIAHVRSLVRDGFIPRVRAIACNNGLKWNESGQKAIERANFGEQVTWDYVNHDVLVNIMQRTKPVDETLRLTGKAIVEDMNFSRVCIGRIPVAEIAALMKRHGERLLERNIRRYLGLHGNRVNEGIRATLLSEDPANFYFFNNGLTLVCDDFSYNALQGSDYQIKVDNLQIVNGGQTCMTIFKTAQELEGGLLPLSDQAAVLVRIYKLPRDNQDIVLQITNATNSQNPVDLKDLRANDAKQQELEQSIQDLGYNYRRKRMDGAPRASDITSGAAAEAVLSVWRQAPHQAKFLIREHFGKLYDTIFRTDLNGAQVVIAVLLYRIAENHRRRPHDDDPGFVRYASCFIAMQMGRRLLKVMKIEQKDLDHTNFTEAKSLIEKDGEAYFRSALKDIKTALKKLYGNHEVTSLQLSATFRRGDLIEFLHKLKI